MVMDSPAEAVSQVVTNAFSGGGGGLVRRRIWTPSSSYAATAAYVLPPDVNVAMFSAPNSSRAGVSVMLPAAVMADGSVMSSIWTLLSPYAATAA